ncbi:cysteine--tRNA ligase [Carboxydocella sp. JDF658]|uniref:cysteine--tRNA ligase n=1 Tax=Carboxydocella sp. JDF658 TaxID=1926600 RepID=UPI0009AC59CA|nr:cysteine--tRNA ligase [Carboxydocella sp. JDF658]
MTIKIYNTMTRQKEDFQPRSPGKVRMYVCGPTTYNFIHLGNARPLIVFDAVRRYLEYRGYEVIFVQNFTDIDDKIIKRAQETGEDALQLSARYINEFFKDAQALGVKPATHHPKVTEHIPEIIEMIAGLIEKGFAYEVDGDVYYAVEKFASYGKLSGRSLEDMQAGARVEVDERKRHPMDFALWKKAKLGEPSWPSPWGEGRPGWHIECSVMSLKYLGAEFDIHGGGFDLIFPHHENEIAQSEAYLGQPFARYWMHNGFITVKEEKMSKSLGNFFTVREILQHFSGQVVRFFMLSSHYRNPLDYSPEKLEEAKKGLERLSNALANGQEYSNGVNGIMSEEAAAAREEFIQAMDDDFNTALALSVLFELARQINAGVAAGEEKEKIAGLTGVLAELAQVLGLELKAGEKAEADAGLLKELVDFLLLLRQEARARKDWTTADAIRNKLGDLGIIVEDTPNGPRWKRK